jgi:chromosome segregation ATPase
VKSRFLPFINALGCLALAGVILVQWNKERALDGTISQLRSELSEARAAADAQRQRMASLERDISVLKESLEATQQAMEVATRALEEKEAVGELLVGELAAVRAQVALWQEAIVGRDEKIRELGEELVATRARLDTALVRLKEAGAR